MRAYYSCYYDGKECDKTVPKLDKDGYLIKESNKEIKKKYGHFLSKELLDNSWDVCDKCDRNYSISGCCYGRFKTILGEKE